jgi:hypothetical protein
VAYKRHSVRRSIPAQPTYSTSACRHLGRPASKEALGFRKTSAADRSVTRQSMIRLGVVGCDRHSARTLRRLAIQARALQGVCACSVPHQTPNHPYCPMVLAQALTHSVVPLRQPENNLTISFRNLLQANVVAASNVSRSLELKPRVWSVKTSKCNRDRPKCVVGSLDTRNRAVPVELHFECMTQVKQKSLP